MSNSEKKNLTTTLPEGNAAFMESFFKVYPINEFVEAFKELTYYVQDNTDYEKAKIKRNLRLILTYEHWMRRYGIAQTESFVTKYADK